MRIRTQETSEQIFPIHETPEKLNSQTNHIFPHQEKKKLERQRGLHIFSFLIYKAPISMLPHMTGTENRTRGGNKQLMCSISWMDGDNGNTVSGC